MQENRLPAFVLDTACEVDFEHVKARKAEGVPSFVLRNAKDITVHGSTPVGDVPVDSTANREM